MGVQAGKTVLCLGIRDQGGPDGRPGWQDSGDDSGQEETMPRWVRQADCGGRPSNVQALQSYGRQDNGEGSGQEETMPWGCGKHVRALKRTAGRGEL